MRFDPVTSRKYKGRGKNAVLVDWWSEEGRVGGWEDGRMGRMEGWEGWKDGRMEGWEDGRMGRMEGWEGWGEIESLW